MYFDLVNQFAKNLQNIELWLDKAESFAKDKKISVDVLLNARLAPDMRGFIYQVTSASDYVKGGAALLSGSEIPKYEDNETTLAEVRERIRKTAAFVENIPEEKFQDAGNRIVKAWGKDMKADVYLRQILIPNAFFHITMAYAILRNQGVDVGKLDFVGFVEFLPR